MKIKQILLFILTIAILSCNIESVDDPDKEPYQNEDDSTLIKEIIYNKGTDDEYSEVFSYDGNKLISVDYSDGSKNIYTYDGNNNLVKDEYFEDSELVASVSLEYNLNNKMASYTETFSEPSGLSDHIYKHDFTYDNDGTITDKVYENYNNAGFELDRTETITLTGKNISEISGDDDYTISYGYDNKNGVFKNIHAIEVLNILSENEFGALIYGNTNNITSYIESDTSISDNYIDSYIYTYNDDDYPKTCIYRSKYGNEEDEVETIEYIYYQ